MRIGGLRSCCRGGHWSLCRVGFGNTYGRKDLKPHPQRVPAAWRLLGPAQDLGANHTGSTEHLRPNNPPLSLGNDQEMHRCITGHKDQIPRPTIQLLGQEKPAPLDHVSNMILRVLNKRRRKIRQSSRDGEEHADQQARDQESVSHISISLSSRISRRRPKLDRLGTVAFTWTRNVRRCSEDYRI